MADILEPTVGARAIDFSLSATNGSLISLADYHNKTNIYLFFIREFN